MHNEPIDVLKVASDRLHLMRSYAERVDWMQVSAGASLCREQAAIEVAAAQRDMTAVHALAAYLMEQR